MNDEPLTECPECQGELKRVISGGVIRVGYGDKKEYYEKVIKKDVKEIVDKIRKGDEKTAADVFGEK